MANREIQPPGGDLGVNTSGRAGLINFLSAKRLFGDGVGGGGGRGKDYKNEAKLFKFQQQVLDERERAQAAREEMLYGNKAGIDLGAEQVSQNQGREHYQEMLNMVKDAKAQGASGEQLQQLVTSFDLETPRGGRARGTFDIVGGPKPPTGPAPDGPGTVVSDDPPITDGPGPKEPAKKRRTAADVRLDMKSAEDEYDAAVGAGASDEDLADLASKGSMLSDEHYLLARKEGGQRDKGARKKAGLPTAGGTAGYTFESLDGGANDSRVRSTKSRGETLKKMQENVDYGKESLGIGSVGNDGSIGMGDSGVRSAPSGESGIIPGSQF